MREQSIEFPVGSSWSEWMDGWWLRAGVTVLQGSSGLLLINNFSLSGVYSVYLTHLDKIVQLKEGSGSLVTNITHQETQREATR